MLCSSPGASLRRCGQARPGKVSTLIKVRSTDSDASFTVWGLAYMMLGRGGDSNSDADVGKHVTTVSWSQ